MEITSLGHSAYKIKGKSAALVTDPYDSESVGLKFAKHIACDIVTVSHDHADHNATSQLDQNPYVIHGPGEYEIKGVGIVGLPTYHDAASGAERGKNTIYHIEIDGVHIVHLGDLGHTLAAKDLEALGNVDILFVPVGGHYTIDAKIAVQIVHEIDPNIVIPMHYGRAELNQKAFGMLAPLADFFKEIGKDVVAPQPKLVITKDKLPEELQVVVLE